MNPPTTRKKVDQKQEIKPVVCSTLADIKEALKPFFHPRLKAALKARLDSNSN